MDHQEALDLLGLHDAQDINEASIRDAFRCVVKSAHPDVGGNEDRFDRLVCARRMLLENLLISMPTIEVRTISDTEGVVIRACPSCHGHVETSTCKTCNGRGGTCRQCRGRGYTSYICPRCENFGTITEHINLPNGDTVTIDGELYRVILVAV
jgi:DnaJ-class molecular chaperone